jgi:putative lipase involved disintegration of autophagic bodies
MSLQYKRAQVAEVMERKAAWTLAAPYRSGVTEWHHLLATLRVRKTAASSTEDEQLQARLKLGELLETVQHRRVEFNLAMQDYPMTGALADLDRSLSRLTDELRDELRS